MNTNFLADLELLIAIQRAQRCQQEATVSPVLSRIDPRLNSFILPRTTPNINSFSEKALLQNLLLQQQFINYPYAANRPTMLPLTLASTPIINHPFLPGKPNGFDDSLKFQFGNTINVALNQIQQPSLQSRLPQAIIQEKSSKMAINSPQRPAKRQATHDEKPKVETSVEEEEELDLPNEDEEPREKLQKAEKIRSRKKIKKRNRCNHSDRKHYAKGLCNQCYHKKNRKQKPKISADDHLSADNEDQRMSVDNQEKVTEETEENQLSSDEKNAIDDKAQAC